MDEDTLYIEDPLLKDKKWVILSQNILLVLIWSAVISVVLIQNILTYSFFVVSSSLAISYIISDSRYVGENRYSNKFDSVRNLWSGVFIKGGYVGNFIDADRSKIELESRDVRKIKMEEVEEIERKKSVLDREAVILYGEESKKVILNTKEPDKVESIVLSNKI